MFRFLSGIKNLLIDSVFSNWVNCIINCSITSKCFMVGEFSKICQYFYVFFAFIVFYNCLLAMF